MHFRCLIEVRPDRWSIIVSRASRQRKQAGDRKENTENWGKNGGREGERERGKEGGAYPPDVGVLVRDEAEEAVGDVQLDQVRVESGGGGNGLEEGVGRREEGGREGGREG